MRTVHVGIGHNNDPPVAQLRDIEISFLLTVAILFWLSNAGTDGGDHRLDLVVLEKLIDPCLLNVDQFAPNGQDRLISAITALLGRTTCGVALNNVKLGQLRVAFTAIRQFAWKSASCQRAFANGLARFACRFPGPRRRQYFFKNAPRHRRILIEIGH